MKYQMENQMIINTDKAGRSWNEITQWNGKNHISQATGSQWEHETLYQSRRGRYYVIQTSQWQGVTDHAFWLDSRDALAWLLRNGYDTADDIPAGLIELIDEVEE